ncbi:AP-3 complex subunit delta [Humulus lupulus]|uniref:AP-3 complex subunit delta n=1 Tax=Humulus lupulus TaxID=3486 RepID=UPI002B410E4C|nr:AP-3 complex subunit delta [Humulus lupulus]
MAGSSIMDTLFQRTLEDLIKGLRLQLIGESAFISKAMDEIRREIKSTDPHTKANALQKLSYLSSLYFYDMSFAAFHVVELMSSTRFVHKRIAYHAASHSFRESTPVLVLITNQLRKDLTSTNEYEVSLALDCLARIGTVDLARDLTPEIFTLLSSSKVFVRKKAIGVVLRVFEKYPDAARVCFKRLVENLESSDPQIVSAVVGVFCELASKDPRSYLPLAPEFYKILVDSKNNWVLIKVLKIFAELAPLEPRLAKRVVDPICDHMRRTGAKSLMFECIRTVVTSFTDYESAVKLAVEKIRELLVEDDPNLKYLALQALLIVAPNHSWAVLENKEVVIKFLSDLDPNIKLESLNLVMAMVSENNVVEISRVLLNYALKSDPVFCNEILGSILSTCCRNVYEIIIDFDWYVSLLGEMSRIPHCQKGDEIEKQVIDIGMRVKDVRPELVRISRDLLIDPALLGNPFLHSILSSAAWVSGVHVEFSRNPLELMEALLQPRTCLLPPSIRAVYIQSSFKVLVFCLHSYIVETEITASSSYRSNVVLPESEFGCEGHCLEGSELETNNASSNFEGEGFNSRVLNQSTEERSVDYGEETNAPQGQTPSLPSLDWNAFTDDSVMKMLNKIEVALSPLTDSHDIEILERARNLLCFIELIKQELPESQKEESLQRGETEAYKIVELMQDAFSDELGPVSVTAQERVPVPANLVLKENLADLDTVLPDVQLSSLDSFALGSPLIEESAGVAQPTLQNKEELEPRNESTSLLSEHRKLHGLYYLPSEKNDLSNDYPPANDLKSQDDAEDLYTLTEQSLVSKKKPNNPKARPVVVKLDEGDLLPIAGKPWSKNDSLSDAVREVLLGSETNVSSSQNKPSDRTYSESKGKEKLNVDSSKLEEGLGLDKHDHRNSSSRKSKHQHGKERRHGSSGDVGDHRDKNGEGKKKSSHLHSRHKSRQRTDAPSIVTPQTQVIPDFLL